VGEGKTLSLHNIFLATSPFRRRKTTMNAREREDRNRVIRKLKSGKYRLYSRKKNPRTGKRRNLGTFDSLEAAKKHERAVQFFKRKG
jgi:hypothetical protein